MHLLEAKGEEKEMSEKEKYSIEMRAGVPVLVGKGWCHPASGAEIWYAARVDALEVENKRLREALELHHEYEKLLGDELNEIVGLALGKGKA
jgi:hypothetical protein